MKITVERFEHNEDETISRVYLDGVYQCFALEDQYRLVKVAGDTRIPSGTYRVTLRLVGGKNATYSKKYPTWHKGMLWVRDVPGFEYILIHQGNTDKDTEGCLLLGTKRGILNGRQAVLESAIAYKRFYLKVIKAFESGEEINIEYIDK
jgi:hypothetical protein